MALFSFPLKYILIQSKVGNDYSNSMERTLRDQFLLRLTSEFHVIKTKNSFIVRFRLLFVIGEWKLEKHAHEPWNI